MKSIYWNIFYIAASKYVFVNGFTNFKTKKAAISNLRQGIKKFNEYVEKSIKNDHVQKISQGRRLIFKDFEILKTDKLDDSVFL